MRTHCASRPRCAAHQRHAARLLPHHAQRPHCACGLVPCPCVAPRATLRRDRQHSRCASSERAAGCDASPVSFTPATAFPSSTTSTEPTAIMRDITGRLLGTPSSLASSLISCRAIVTRPIYGEREFSEQEIVAVNLSQEVGFWSRSYKGVGEGNQTAHRIINSDSIVDLPCLSSIEHAAVFPFTSGGVRQSALSQRSVAAPSNSLHAAINSLVIGATADLTDRCKAVPVNLMFCLKYAVGEADMPANACCPAARNESNYCLCDLVRAVYYGEQMQGYTLKYDRVVNLSTICGITAGNITFCPVVLGLPPGSPDLAAFNGTAPPPRNGGFALKARYSYAVASAAFSAVIYSALSF
ncbi:uncharacterized protein LOC144710904 [Wolffia australiana]